MIDLILMLDLFSEGEGVVSGPPPTSSPLLDGDGNPVLDGDGNQILVFQ